MTRCTYLDFQKKPLLPSSTVTVFELLRLQSNHSLHVSNRLPMIANSISHFPSYLICPCEVQHHQRLQRYLCWNTAQNRPPIHFTIRASSIENSTSRRRRKVKSNAELCEEIREFLVAAGFPVGHVPSMKELSEHGRNDLANIVRRKGYKLIRELLANSIQTDVDKSDTDSISTEKQSETDHREDKLAGQNGKLDEFPQELLLSTEAPIMGNHSGTLNIDQQLEANNDNLLTKNSLADLSFEGNALYNVKGNNEDIETMVEYKSPSSELSVMDNLHCSSKIDPDLKSDVDFHAPQETSASPCIEERPTESSTDMSLKEKVANFIQNGELDMVEDNIDGLLKDSGAEESNRVEESEKENESQSEFPSGKNEKDAHSSHLVSLASNGSKLTMRDDRSSTEGLPAVETDQTLDVETSKRDNQAEIDRLKLMLHQKELELSILREQIEKEKLALTVLQAKAETEINKAQKLISDKDAELYSAEEGLSGLEEVEIHYRGDGEIVEVTGSFNGWHHQIKMDPQLPSSIKDPIGSRTSRVWSTVLWLYPGIYEIKFVVDGQWKIDPHRESVTTGGICNNILRVKR